ncbi:MAG: ribosome assembly RNA-binding protein YhbY [Zetaproteobacteria bacterium CG_4_9_14_3_um_filter_49_83]|nr:MAG: hypothetical protein AUJ56_07565 [Zetaproteobacteria bacterium CG1_02_49_23]PIQ29895.1 MAG: ribosome assembly RNA-binding protein YhbY [Zetaproteobacteria bacterium CG17_big_fil_post_rev_8_21_14_2_50_50_13]PIV31024.1 MAG: ribosome assembly RNA-binding protein YhbY [Zetaproteobacteria bacterium CG02_land_8_20_14_3_00_50_9]PIY55207.1 MAG: ribosome assembly RNA-binding protein YhbY [Zetaproteobacteria bacterium CG_4_10_14_0_8_um_filter_49_80]PJA36229.1 MAG: ribosome assembly RNA-binding pr
MSLSSKQRKELRAAAHHLKPVVRVGQNGVSEGVIAEADQALTIHELIKVHVQGEDREERKQDAERLCAATRAELVTNIGKIFVVYRANPDE